MRNWTDLIPQKGKLATAEWKILTEPIYWVNGHPIPEGTRYKTFVTRNFGWVVLHPDSKITPRFARF